MRGDAGVRRMRGRLRNRVDAVGVHKGVVRVLCGRALKGRRQWRSGPIN